MHVEGLVAIILFFAVPILAVTLGIIASIKRNRQNTELRMEIVRSGTSPEIAELLLKRNNSRARSKVVALRWGATFTGVGLVALVCKLAGVELYFSLIQTWLYLALGAGIGLVVAFVVEILLAKHNPELFQEKEK